MASSVIIPFPVSAIRAVRDNEGYAESPTELRRHIASAKAELAEREASSFERRQELGKAVSYVRRFAIPERERVLRLMGLTCEDYRKMTLELSDLSAPITRLEREIKVMESELRDTTYAKRPPVL